MFKLPKSTAFIHLSSMIVVLAALATIAQSALLYNHYKTHNTVAAQLNVLASSVQNIEGSVSKYHPLSIEHLRLIAPDTVASEIKIKEKVSEGSNYSRNVVSYTSDRWNVNALMTVPNGEPPEGGWPAIIFNHGWIPPDEYKTTERYESYIDYFASRGYVVFKSDYRGFGDSEGYSSGTYTSHDYVIDVLNAFKSVQALDYVNADKVGMWGHSMGGFITLKAMIVEPQIKAGAIWGGVVGEYKYILDLWGRPEDGESNAFFESNGDLKYPTFWQYISPISHVDTIQNPIQLHHGLADEIVPWHHSEDLNNALLFRNKYSEIYTYPNGDHNLRGAAFEPAMERTLSFFDRFVKSSRNFE